MFDFLLCYVRPGVMLTSRNFERVFVFAVGRYGMNYKQKIIELIEKIDNDGLLRRIYLMLIAILGE